MTDLPEPGLADDPEHLAAVDGRGRRRGPPARSRFYTVIEMTTQASSPDVGGASSQTVRTQLRLRELIVGGELSPAAASPSLGSSSGSARRARRFARPSCGCEEEGLLEALPGGGFAVKDSPKPTSTMRSNCAARSKAWPRGWRPSAASASVLLAEARDCLERIDEMLAAPELSEDASPATSEQNGRFHAVIAEMSGSALVQRQLYRAKTLPFASPNSFVMMQSTARMRATTS